MVSSRVVLIASLALLALPTATAHTAVFSTDNALRASAGLLNEPTSTYAVTGLDLCFTTNDTARTPIVGFNPGNLTVTLKSPDGKTLSTVLSVPFGRTNCVVFSNPLLLTEPGQYLLDISGSINGSTFAATNVAAGGAVRAMANLTFPDNDVPTLAELRDELAAAKAQLASAQANNTVLTAQYDALASRVATLEAKKDDKGGVFSPMPAFVPVLGILLLAAVVARRRA